MTKISLLVLNFFIIISGYSLAQQKKDTSFSLTFSTYNHAERIFNGTTTYKLTSTEIIVSNRAIFSQKDTILYKSKIDNVVIERISKLQLDSLNNNYFNNCVMITSGTEYFISLNTENSTHKIHLHHYYLESINKLVIELNKLIAEKYRIRYLSSSTNQSCD